MATTWKFYLTSRDAWDAMYDDCKRATSSIDMEQFIVKYEPGLARFFDIFMEKAREGVTVRLLCDMVGSYQIYESAILHDLRNAGVQVRFVHPISFWRVTNFTSWLFRDHRKILVVDGTVAHTGGVGLNEKTKNWRDTNIRVTGEVVSQMQEDFELMWQSVLDGRAIRSRRKRTFVDGFMSFVNAPRFRQRYFYNNLSRTLKTAKRYIYFTTPYLVPPFRLFRKLRSAARRGVDVRLLVTRSSDSKIVDTASQSFYALALRAGIRLYLYDVGVMHAKVGIVDDTWATVGSANLDSQSFKFSYELNLVTDNTKCVAELKELFLADLDHSEELQREAWERRSRLSKFLEIATWPAHWVL